MANSLKLGPWAGRADGRGPGPRAGGRWGAQGQVLGPQARGWSGAKARALGHGRAAGRRAQGLGPPKAFPSDYAGSMTQNGHGHISYHIFHELII